MLPCVIGVFLTILNPANAILGTNVTVGKLGVAIGKKEETKWSKREFYSFKGIPFAKPPIGNLRYAPPVKLDSWNDHNYDATYFRNICPQTKQPGYDVESYDEDCLHLNVYVPAGEKNLLPVMIWLHGGYFMSGHAQKFEPHYLMESDVILVVPQFRIGPLGLLSMESEEIPGNVQLLDQVMAMEWVRDNIECFGGATKSVTLFGQSSGGYSVNLHLLSPLSEGLFHRTIIQSTAVYTTGMIDRNPVKSTTEIARVLGCDVGTIESITRCMKTLPAKTILQGFDKYAAENSANGRDSWGGNRVVIQRSGNVRFLMEEPSVLIQKGKYLKLPMIGGTTSEDGSIIVSGIYDALSSTGSLEDPEFLKYELMSLVLKQIAIEDETGGLSEILREKYFPNNECDDFLKMVPGLTNMSNVLLFRAGVYRMLNENRKFQPTYLYNFEYRGSQTRFGYESKTRYPFDGGVAHSDDCMYLFPFPDKLTENDTVVAKSMIQLWTSFAINGTPSTDRNQDWPKMSTRNGPYLKIGSELKIGDYFFDEYGTTLNEDTRSSNARVSFSYGLLAAIKAIYTTFFQ